MDSAPAPATFQSYLDQLIAYGSEESRKQDLLAARAEYTQLTGEVFEDDKCFEMRMASFLEFYLLDRISPVNGKTPAQEVYERYLREGPAEHASVFRAFTETVHGLFEVKKLKKDLVRLRELYTGKDHDVTERRQLVGLDKGDVLEARLIPFSGMLLFSPAFCYHPREAVKLILKEVKRRKKKEPTRPARELVYECAKMALKTDRYRQIAVERIYEFENPVL
jgi:hypothetical protein